MKSTQPISGEITVETAEMGNRWSIARLDSRLVTALVRWT
jgi:hypothetical protein